MTKWVLEQEQYHRRLTLAALTQRTESETRNQLTRMVERGWVQARGEGKGGHGTCQRRSIVSWNRRQAMSEFAVSNRFSRSR